MTHTASGAGNGQMIHLIVVLAALSMDGFPFAHLGDLSDLPAETPSPCDWAAVGMSPPRNPAKLQDTKRTNSTCYTLATLATPATPPYSRYSAVIPLLPRIRILY